MSMNSKPNDKADIAILRTLESDDKFTFSFHLKTSKFGGIDKQFDMCRNVDESVSNFLERLNNNVEKIISKKSKRKKQAQDESARDTLEISLCENGQHVQDLSYKIQDVLLKSGTELWISGEKFKIDINPPIVESAVLSNVILAGFMTYPHKFKLESAVKNDSIYEWYISEEKFEEILNGHKEGQQEKTSNGITKKKPPVDTARLNWRKKADGFYFTPTKDDVHRYVKFSCKPGLNDRFGPVFEIISKFVVSNGPDSCPFEKRHSLTKEIATNDKFRVVSYNLLADLYADSDYSRTVLFAQCPHYAMDINYRKQLIIKELLGYKADIICLQEVDNKIFDFDLLPVLSDHDDFDGVFKRKGGQVSEGLACFWRTTKFKKIEWKQHILSETIQSDLKFENMLKIVKSQEKLSESTLNRTTAINLVALESLVTPNTGLIVATTHLYFRPDADHLRLIQIALCMHHIEEMLQLMSKTKPEMKFAVILAGDFNSTPPFGVLQFMREGRIEETHPDWSSCKDELVSGLSIQHPFSMDSACGEPKFTNYTLGFKDCLDYIFYEKDKLQVDSVVPFPSEEELKEFDAIPSKVFPSDHIASICDLKWMK